MRVNGSQVRRGRTGISSVRSVEPHQRQEAALCHKQLYQKRMIRAHNKKMRPRYFQDGYLVLKKILSIQKDHQGKWAPNYEGPYVVKKAFSRGALILTYMDGEDLPLPIN